MATEGAVIPEITPARSLAVSAKRGARWGPEAIFVLGLTVVLALIFLFPLVWTVSSSLKSPAQIFSFPPALVPIPPQWVNYATVLQKVPYGTWVLNSFIVVILSTGGVVVTSSLVAYSFARFEYRGRDLIFLATLGTMMLPAQVTLIPQFVLFNALGFINTLLPLWVPSWFGGGAFFIFLLRQFFLSLPTDLDEAALMDGANVLQVYWSILMPLCKPALATVAIISFIESWNDFLGPLIYLNTPDKFTVAVGLSFFQNVPEAAGEPLQHLLMAASVMAILPPLLLFFSFQRYFVQGIVLSGIKG
jgi:multiple sugar transport system permease protein